MQEMKSLEFRDKRAWAAEPGTCKLFDAPAKRSRARKIKGMGLGPFETLCHSMDRGHERRIEIVRVTPCLICYRLVGQSKEFSISHSAAFQRAVAQAAGFDPSPRESKRITRSNI